ncbi:hypothetical protein ACH5RR_021822 [Cinchona calisaya]|uniref:Acid phosphatase/vanadium-dependent haloperoxidase-related protein n=1 Tax=Cinchona calisaya TaxID=153742 RepID=A0ABD2ZJQ0_9GENT
MMLLQSGSFLISSFVLSHNGEMRKHVYLRNRLGSGEVSHLFLRSSARESSFGDNLLPCSSTTCCVCNLCSSSVEMVEIFQNKVLTAAAVSATVGQLSKPFTSTILYGNNFEFKNAFQAGGFPSTHSSAAVATAITIGLERGFSDAIFGLAVVYAGLVMYDAQGVRREVGSHAKVLNRVLYRNKLDSLTSSKEVNDPDESFPRESSSNLETRDPPLGKYASFLQRLPNASLLLKSGNRSTPFVNGESESIPFGCTPLKESVGHTKIEVIAGALLGFFVGLGVCTI